MNCPACNAENMAGTDICASCGVSLTHQMEPRSDAHHSIVMDPIASLLPGPPECLSADDSVATAVGLMREKRIGCVFIADGDGVLTGIFTEHDLLRKVAGQAGDLSAVKMSDVMTPSPAALTDQAAIAYALHLMSIHGYRHIPIVDDDGRPTGVMTFRRVVEYIGDLFA